MAIGDTVLKGINEAGGSPDPVTAVDLVDEFFGGINTTGNIGELGWQFLGGAVNIGIFVANHPGTYTLLATGGTIAFFLYDDDASADLIQPEDLWDITFILRQVVAITDEDVFVGIMDNINATPGVQHHYGFAFDTVAGDTSWMCSTGNGVAPTRVSSGVLHALNTWFKLRVKRTATGVEFYVDGVLKQTIMTTLPTEPMNVGIRLASSAGTKYLILDFFRGQLTVTR